MQVDACNMRLRKALGSIAVATDLVAEGGL
jgi:hypothetical protein